MMHKSLRRPVGLIFAAILVLTLPGWKPAAVPHPFAPESSTSLPQQARAPISALIGTDQVAYHAQVAGTGYRLENPANDLSASFTEAGVQVEAGQYTWKLALNSWGYGDAQVPVQAARPEYKANRVTYTRGAVREWYLNGPFGLEQGFTLDRPPSRNPTAGPLTLSLALGGDLRAAVDTSGQGLVLSDPGGADVLLYAGLSAYDSVGRGLPAKLVLRGKVLLLQVNDAVARYPLTIDPFVQKSKLSASDKAASDAFGWSVSISGDVVVVGVPWADPGGTNAAGAAYLFVKPGGGWANMTQTAKLTALDKAAIDYFGWSVSISGDVVVVGAHQADPGGTSNAGAAYVFVKPGGGWGDMTQTAKLTASDKAANDSFGSSVAISGDVVVVGAPWADPGGTSAAGASYIFFKPGGGWADMTQTAKLTASDKAADDLFGTSVSISADVVVVGAYGADPGGMLSAGAAYVFVKPGGGWTDMTQTAKLTASDKAVSDIFGYSVSISGDVVVVGAYYADLGGTVDAGASYVFVKPGGVWSGNLTETAKLTASDRAAGDWFGRSVSISGDIVVVGAIFANPGETTDAGASYVFVKPGGGWSGNLTETAKLTASDKAADDWFGWSVSISGDVVVVGVPYADSYGTTAAGVSYVFVDWYSTTTTITSDSPDPSLVGGTVNVSVTVSGGSTTPTGTVDITGADTNCSISLSGGSGNCNVTFNTVGAKTLTATYNGDATHGGSSDTENHAVKANTTTTIVVDTPDPSAINQVVTVGVTVTGGPTTPTGTVSISGADVNCVITLSAGSGTCNALFTSAGAKILTATYNGDATHASSSDTEGHKVNPLTSNFYSAGTYDGWILESAETSNVGGTFNPTATTFRLGDDASDRQYRSILSFNTASLPDNAVITSIVLKIKKQGLVGTDPFTTHQGLLVDIRKPYFGTALGLVASDFQALASKNSVGTFGTIPSAGWYSVTLSSTARPYINKTGTTQFRLRFQKGDNDDMGADYMKFFSGNYTTSTSRPLLIIQYYVP